MICGKRPVEMHHVFFGRNRKTCDKDGYLVPLCPGCHRGARGAHNDRELDLYLKRRAQTDYEKSHTREEFIARYGKSYL